MGKCEISPIGKLETRENKAETVNTEHVQSIFFQSLGLVGTLHESGFPEKLLLELRTIIYCILISPQSVELLYLFYLFFKKYLYMRMHGELNYQISCSCDSFPVRGCKWTQ